MNVIDHRCLFCLTFSVIAENKFICFSFLIVFIIMNSFVILIFIMQWSLHFYNQNYTVYMLKNIYFSEADVWCISVCRVYHVKCIRKQSLTTEQKLN
jgi:hypothetical protein